MEDFEFELTEDEIFYIENYKLPGLIHSFFNLELEQQTAPVTKFDVLIKIARLRNNEFFSDIPSVMQEIWRNCGYIIMEVSHGLLDDTFFNNIAVNKEKIKFMIPFFEKHIEQLTKKREKIEEGSEIFEISENIIRNLNGLTHYLCKYTPDVKLKLKLSDDELDAMSNIKPDGRVSTKAPTSLERIKALKEFCPELWSKLSRLNKDNQKQIIHLITAVNLEDSYKYSFGDRQHQIKSKVIKNFDTLVFNLNKSIE
jgi:hypothetical protein